MKDRFEDITLSRGVKNSQIVRLNRSSFQFRGNGLQLGSEFTGRPIVVTEGSRKKERGTLVWTGKSATPDTRELAYASEDVRQQVEAIVEKYGDEGLYFSNSTSVTIAQTGSHVEGYVMDRGKEFVFRSLDEEFGIWSEVDRSIESTEHNQEISGVSFETGLVKGRSDKRISNDQHQIRVLIAYSTPAASFVGNIYSNAGMLTAGMNTALENSGTSTRVETAHVMQVNYAEPTSLPAVSSSLGSCPTHHPITYFVISDNCRLALAGDGILDEVHEAREMFHADYVVLVTARNVGSGASGVANTGATVQAAYATINIRSNPTYTTFAHESGHIFGAAHQGRGGTVLAWYARPHSECSTVSSVPKQGFQTIMWSGNNECSNGTGTDRIPFYSNPNIWYLVYGPSPWCPQGESECVIECIAMGESGANSARLLEERQSDNHFYRLVGSSPDFRSALSSYGEIYVCPDEVSGCAEELDPFGAKISRNKDQQFGSDLEVFPNPSNSEVSIILATSVADDAILLEIWDVLGRRIRTWLSAEIPPDGVIRWNGLNASGGRWCRDVYCSSISQ